MADNTYTTVAEGIVVCNDCGAHAAKSTLVVHATTCDPGCSERWAKYYEEAVDDEALDKAYKESAGDH